MSTSTPRLGLTKPASGENYSRALLNSNYDLIDAHADSQIIWNKQERILLFKNGGFAWGTTAWDAGPLAINRDVANSSQMSSPEPTFASVSTTNGAIKLVEPGVYDIQWIVVPGADPSNSGYRIVTLGTWPGSPAGANAVLGQTQKANSTYWESVIEANNIRVPAANLEVRLTGVQSVGTTNSALVKVTQRGKF